MDTGGPGKDFAKFFINHHSDDLRSIILSPDPRLHYPLRIESGAIKMLEGEREFECRKCKHRIPLPLGAEDQVGVASRHDNGLYPMASPVGVLFRLSRKTSALLQILYLIEELAYPEVVTSSDACKDVSEKFKVYPELESRNSLPKPTSCPSQIVILFRRTNELKTDVNIPDDVIMKFKQFWSEFKYTPLQGRNAILRGICPQVFGLFTVKLAVALTLIGGVQHIDVSGTKVRGESHLLLVGDPGTGKSQFLKFAAKLSNRSVITTGLGSTSAGLTVTAVKDGGEWMLEAGALVLADGGICCIDEFDSMREHDRATIHEAMEQQTISVAKAGLVTTLSTRTIVFGATNPKGHYDPDQSLSVNTTLSGPLISRFDIVLVLLDTKNPEWDAVVSSHILAEVMATEISKELLIYAMQHFNISDNYGWQAELEKANCDEDLADSWPLPLLRRYFFHSLITVFDSAFSEESERHIAARTTVRMLESLIRLAQAHARLMFRNEVTRLDAITAIFCIESSMTTSAIVDSVGNALHSNFTDNPDQEYAKQERHILEKLSTIDEFPDIHSIEGS
ncbi:hypothetical protein RJ639_033721 [Escallonia herrerae]|uniref:DNA helicase n=1 Tax=Escallonia herrerae TaxID=1293975 RepID=A0AA89BK83_9ASTE|nr:hypothetical protein RJ639_033721 [Escallonia herrerae]